MNHESVIDNSLTQTIIVTDSGLGGLSVFTNIANRLAKSSPWQKVKLLYFNAWPAPHKGYNHFDTKDKRAKIFNNAMNAMDEFHPDLILIACNTLSVIYPQTSFYNSSDTKVEGIVDYGIKMIYEKLTKDPDSVAVVLGTPTTADARSHEKGLIKLGISKDRIISIGCTNLAGKIERQPFSDTVDQTIKKFARQTGSILNNFSGNVYAALCCTHFGYRRNLFEQAFAQFIKGKVTILDPNIRMAQQIFDSWDQTKTFSTKIDMQIVSKAILGDEQINDYLKLLPELSPLICKALKNYKYDSNLFSVDLNDNTKTNQEII